MFAARRPITIELEDSLFLFLPALFATVAPELMKLAVRTAMDLAIAVAEHIEIVNIEAKGLVAVTVLLRIVLGLTELANVPVRAHAEPVRRTPLMAVEVDAFVGVLVDMFLALLMLAG